jgi:hypothetical protein
LTGLASAATVATEGNGAKCLLLEKSPNEIGGGNSPFSSGRVLFTTNVDSFFTYLKELRDEMDSTPDDALSAYAEDISENLDWFRALPNWEEESRPSSYSRE